MYFPKNTPEFPNFDNSRPITKTSPIYKLLEIILDNRIKKQLAENQSHKINITQLGFQQGIGCEVGLLRYKELLTNLKKTKK